MKRLPILHFSLFLQTRFARRSVAARRALFSLFLLAACSGGHQYRTMLNRADSLMTAHPDSAYAIITSIDSADIQKQRKATRMRYELLRAEAQNKAYVPFTTDSVLRRVVRYYDRHGSANQQLKARYLLGCAYRDMHEAPLAIITWEEAVDRADTLSNDCDYSTLYRVYGQMAEVYKRQHLPQKQIYADNHYSKYALLARDTLEYIQGQLQRNAAYYNLMDTAALYDNTEYVLRLYMERGMASEAAKVYPTAILCAVEHKQYERAHKMMQAFEQGSELFDNDGNIAPSREQYYYVKGMYLLGTNRPDSAELFFRKLIPFESRRLDAYRGLLSLFRQVKIPDSIAKYAGLYEDELSLYLNNTQARTIVETEAIYSYHRHERMEALLRKKVQNNFYMLVFCLFLIFLLIVSGITSFLYILKKRKRQKKEITALLEVSDKTQSELKYATEELEMLRENLRVTADTALLLKQKEAECLRLQRKVQLIEKEKLQASSSKKRMMLNMSDIVIHFKAIAVPQVVESAGSKAVVTSKPQAEEWAQLLEAFRNIYPQIINLIDKYELTTQETHVMLLMLLDIGNKEISRLIGSSPSRVSTIKSDINRKIFKTNGSRTLLTKLKQL